jgi:hypothetical protein
LANQEATSGSCLIQALDSCTSNNLPLDSRPVAGVVDNFFLATMNIDWKKTTKCPYCPFEPLNPQNPQARGTLNRHIKQQAAKSENERGAHPGEHDPRHIRFLLKRKCHVKAQSEEEKYARRATTKRNYYYSNKEKSEKSIDKRVEDALESLMYDLKPDFSELIAL